MEQPEYLLLRIEVLFFKLTMSYVSGSLEAFFVPHLSKYIYFQKGLLNIIFVELRFAYHRV